LDHEVTIALVVEEVPGLVMLRKGSQWPLVAALAICSPPASARPADRLERLVRTLTTQHA
jgi:hypothetical protein